MLTTTDGGHVQVEVEWVDDLDGGLADLEAYLRQDPRLDDVELRRGRPVAPPETLGVPEILELVATDVSVGLFVHALYDYLRHLLVARAGGKDVRFRLTRTDLPEGARHVELDFTGSADAAERV